MSPVEVVEITKPIKGRVSLIRKSITWRSAYVLSLGGALLVTVSLGSMAAEIGVASVLAWTITSVVGLLQCLLLAELASIFPHKVGGAPAYTHEGLKSISPLFGAISAWGYWVGWIPGVAVNLTLAATYIKAAFLPNINVVVLTLILVVVLYTLNYFGLKLSVKLSICMAICALIPLLIILAAPVFRTSLWKFSNFSPLFPAGVVWYSMPMLMLMAKWMFVAAWSSYGSEMVTTVVGELKHPKKDIPKAVSFAASSGLIAFAVVPTILLAIVGVKALSQDPFVTFLTAASQIFGQFGAAIVSIMLIAALILGAEVFVVSSSRALYQMSQDGLTIKSYSRLNKHGVPVGSVVWDALVTISLLTIFGANIINVVASSNIAYIVVFILLPIAYILIKVRQPQHQGSFHLPRIFVPLAFFIALFNIVLLVFGSSQWGMTVIGVGLILLVTFLPFYIMSNRSHYKTNTLRRNKSVDP